MISYTWIFRFGIRLLGLVLFAWLSVAVPVCQAQSNIVGNEWIDFSRPYLKLAVPHTGVYRVAAADPQILAQGFNLANPSQLRLYYRGAEVPLFIQNGDDPNRFDGSDFLEFWGRRNDGGIDSELYRHAITGLAAPDKQTNANFSLFTDTSYYYLTFTPGEIGLRYNDVDGTSAVGTVSRNTILGQSRIDFVPGGHSLAQPGYNMGGGGSFDPVYLINSDYIAGEGYLSRVFSSTINVTVPTPGATGNGQARLDFRIYGVSNLNEHITEVRVNNGPTQSFSFPLVDVFNFTMNFAASALNNNQTPITFTPKGVATGGRVDNQRLCWLNLQYERNTAMGNQSAFAVTLPNLAQDSRITFTDIGASLGENIWVYDPQGRNRIRGTITYGVGNATLTVSIPKGTGLNQELWVSAESAIATPVAITPVTFNNLLSNDRAGRFLIVTHRSLQSSAEAYKQYRDTNSVNRIPATVVYTDELFDQFTYGDPSPLAIKRFVREALQNWGTKPEYLFLWGKGNFRPREIDLNLVPAWNAPVTDFEYVSNFTPEVVRDNVPLIPVGRVNVRNNQQGLDYLRKIDVYEHLEWELWQKTALHLGGGKTAQEQGHISNYLRGYQQIYEGPPLNGLVHYYQKSSNNPLPPAQGGEIEDFVNNGVGLINFFGHSSVSIFEIPLFRPNIYTNFGRTPLIIANGCYSGDFAATNGVSFGEDWVNIAERGAIGYLSSSSTGFLFQMGEYNQVLYQVAFQDSLGNSVGSSIRETIRRFLAPNPNSASRINHAKQILLQGDPAMGFLVPQLPDLEITAAGIRFEPNDISAQADSFTVYVRVRNLGRSIPNTDSVFLRIEQLVINTGERIAHPLIYVPPFGLEDTVVAVLFRGGRDIAGINQFTFKIDALDRITELREDNNVVVIERLISSRIPAPLYPWPFAVINRNQIALQAGIFGSLRDSLVAYIFEIDTVFEFNSPFLRNSGRINGTAQLGAWPLPFVLQDSTVYYWRVRLADEAQILWAQESFQYINGPAQGWGQARPAQFYGNNTLRLAINRQNRQWDFEPVRKVLTATVAGCFDYTLTVPPTNIEASVEPFPCQMTPSGGIAVALFDGKKVETLTRDNNLGDVTWLQMPSGQGFLKTMIDNMKCGDYLLIMGYVDNNIGPNVQQWDASTFAKLAELGLTDNVRFLQNNDRFILFGTKCAPVGAGLEILRPNSGNTFQLRQELFTRFPSGEVYSPRIGLSNGWLDYIWGWRSLENQNADRASTNLIGIRPNGTEATLLNRVAAGTYDLRSFSQTEYPYLRLEAQVEDSLLRTAPQLDHWYVLYNPVPEALLDPTITYSFSRDTVFEGEELAITLHVRNITEIDMDSLLIRYEVITQDGQIHLLDTIRNRPLKALGGYDFTYRFSSVQPNFSMAGRNQLIVTVNPNFDQPEQFLHNNVFIQTFVVIEDIINPILDVTFDGKRIIDFDIVSPNPTITIEVNDENPFFAITDPNSIDVFFKAYTDGLFDPNIPPPDKIDYNTGLLTFQPAVLPDNRATLTFRPGPLADGTYQLRVQSRDAKGNASGKNFYDINFRVINESTITHVINYPNPFSTSTRFVYTLTGEQLPEIFQLHIYTVSGKLAKVIDFWKEGEVFIGNHVTNFTWDGTDDFGDRLANGVYLFKTVIKMPGETEKPRLDDRNIGQFYKNGWGKMVIMR